MLFTAQISFAQQGYTVNGMVKDSTGLTVPGATVTMLMAKDSLSMSTGMDGIFIFKNMKQPTFTIKITGIGYTTYRKTIAGAPATGSFSLGTIILKTSSRELGVVNIVSVKPVKVKEETI